MECHCARGQRGRLTLLGDLPYKFRNLLPKHLLEDEQIEQVVFRPSRWERPARVWPVHTMAKAVVALTNTHLLLAEEELTHSEDAYGLIVTYLPRRRIQAITLENSLAAPHPHQP